MPDIRNKILSHWNRKNGLDKFILTASLALLLVVGLFLMLHHAPYSPDQFFILAFIIALLTGQASGFLRDWTPPILLILIYEYLRGLIAHLNLTVHYYPMIRFDKFLFGELPTIILQNPLWNPSHLSWYDYVSVMVYDSYYVVPLVIAFIFWLTNREYFEKYVIAMVVLFYAGFATYLLFPAAPPWMASDAGLLGGKSLIRVSGEIFSHISSGTISLPTVYKYLGANQVAAVPSLHVAYAVLTFLFLGAKNRRYRLPAGAYAFAVCFAVIYLGEHYFFDVVLGAAYAAAVFAVVQKWPQISAIFKNRINSKSPQKS